MGPPGPKWKAGRAHKFFIRCFRLATAPRARFDAGNGPANPLIGHRFDTFTPVIFCGATNVARQKISLANF
jgi:hypothetical protein